MDLKNTINNTNTQKENLKTVANNIDNKLVELGGERAESLADIPNKMESMIGQYNKVATFDSPGIIKFDNNTQTVTIPTNTQFVPKFAFVEFGAKFGSQILENVKWDTRKGVRLWESSRGVIGIKVSNAMFSRENMKFKFTSTLTGEYKITKLKLIG